MKYLVHINGNIKPFTDWCMDNHIHNYMAEDEPVESQPNGGWRYYKVVFVWIADNETLAAMLLRFADDENVVKIFKSIHQFGMNDI